MLSAVRALSFDKASPWTHGSISSCTYDSSSPKKLTGYVRDGVTYTVTYPDATHIVIAGGRWTRTITLDASAPPLVLSDVVVFA